MPRTAGYRPGIPQQPYTKWDTDKDEVEVDYKTMDDTPSRSCFSGRKGIVLRVMLVIVIFLLGLILGYVVRRSVSQLVMVPKTKCPFRHGNPDFSKATVKYAQRFTSAKNLEARSREYSDKVHIAGTQENNLLRDKLIDQLKDYGFKVQTPTYKALLSYQHWEKQSLVTMYDDNGTVVYQTDYKGPPHLHHPDLTEAFNAYSPSGTVEGFPLYAGWGMESDFELLEKKYGATPCNGSIVIMRYGRQYRGHKVLNAAKCGAAGVLFFVHPEDCTVPGQKVYPYSRFLPGWAVPRGSVLPNIDGDPLSPDLPSIDGMYRLPESEAVLPPIPNLPISYNDAAQILRGLNSAGLFGDWPGAPEEVVHYTGPSTNGSRGLHKIRMEVNTDLDQREIYNVIGVLEGAVEPDRYVILGSHYDSWTYGTVDPISGTSVIMEIAKALSELVKRDWQPRRTIMLAHWDGEEHGLIGSTEWVEEHRKELTDRAVAYINLDSAVQGNHLFSSFCDALLKDLLLNVTMETPSIQNPDMTVYQDWANKLPEDFTPAKSVQPTGFGSDQGAFISLTGTPCMGFGYRPEKTGKIGGFPAYHTILDEFNMTSRFIDPGFQAHKSVTDMATNLVIRLAESARLPIKVMTFADLLKTGVQGLQEDLKEYQFYPNISDYMQYLEWTVGNFSTEAAKFDQDFQEMDIKDIMGLRRLNDQAMQVSRAFLNPTTHIDKASNRNILYTFTYAPSSTNSAVFGVIRDVANRTPTKTDLVFLKRQISIATLAVQSATCMLNSVPADTR